MFVIVSYNVQSVKSVLWSISKTSSGGLERVICAIELVFVIENEIGIEEFVKFAVITRFDVTTTASGSLVPVALPLHDAN